MDEKDREIAHWKTKAYHLEDKVTRLMDALDELEAQVQSVIRKERNEE